VNSSWTWVSRPEAGGNPCYPCGCGGGFSGVGPRPRRRLHSCRKRGWTNIPHTSGRGAPPGTTQARAPPAPLTGGRGRGGGPVCGGNATSGPGDGAVRPRKSCLFFLTGVRRLPLNLVSQGDMDPRPAEQRQLRRCLRAPRLVPLHRGTAARGSGCPHRPHRKTGARASTPVPVRTESPHPVS